MKFLWQLIKFFIIVMGIIFTHIFVVVFLPYPFNCLNIIITAILIGFIFSADTRALFLVIPTGFFLEILSSTPFGISTISLVVSLSVVAWVLMHIFTNRSAPIVFLSGIAAVLFFRLLFLGFLMIFGNITWGALWSNTGIGLGILWEALFTSVAVFLGYMIVGYLVKRFRPEYINWHSNNKYDAATQHIWHF